MKNLILCLVFITLGIFQSYSQDLYFGYGVGAYKSGIPIEDVRSIHVLGHMDESPIIVGANISTGNSYEFNNEYDWQSFRFFAGSRIIEFPKVGTHLSLMFSSDMQSLDGKFHAVDNGFGANLSFKVVSQLYFNMNYYKSFHRYSRDLTETYKHEFFSYYDHYTLGVLLKFTQ